MSSFTLHNFTSAGSSGVIPDVVGIVKVCGRAVMGSTRGGGKEETMVRTMKKRSMVVLRRCTLLSSPSQLAGCGQPRIHSYQGM